MGVVMLVEIKANVLKDDRLLVDTNRGIDAPTIDGVPFIPMVDLDPNCICAVGCEFGCMCYKLEGIVR